MTRPTASHTRMWCVVFATVLLSSCAESESAGAQLYDAVDELYGSIITTVTATDQLSLIAEIDHSRLAAEQGEIMPPARVVLFSNPVVNAAILQQEPLAALDLPFRVLAYVEKDKPAVIFTSADFLKQRFGLPNGPALEQYEESLLGVTSSVSDSIGASLDTSSFGLRQGIATLSSAYNFEETLERLKTDIMAEADTVWFGEIDYQSEAAALGVELPKLTLLLFGAPGPGGKAMAEYPRMGLDAFCQKVLVIQSFNGDIEVLFNEMPALAELHYGDSALVHKIINKRMRDTLETAIKL